jgi:tetratricopeptide (TPR) repeat protein
MLSKLKSLRETIANYPGNLRARLELARLSVVSMDYEGAREALAFTGDSPALEAARRYLLARSHADEDHPDLALAALRSIALPDVPDDELRRNVTYLKGVCCEQLGQYGEAHTLFLHILSEFPYFKDTRDRVRRTYQKHLESSVEPRAEVLEKRTQAESAEPEVLRVPRS